MEGNSCRMLARLGADVITETNKELKSIPRSERKSSDEEIDCFFDGITFVLQCFDWMAQFCYQYYVRLTVEDITKASRVNEVFQKMWQILFKSVQPNTHTWDHLIVNLNRMRGLKQHTESPCEVEHQIGKAMEGRFYGRDKERSVKAIAQSRANQRLRMSKIKSKQLPKRQIETSPRQGRSKSQPNGSRLMIWKLLPMNTTGR